MDRDKLNRDVKEFLRKRHRQQKREAWELCNEIGRTHFMSMHHSVIDAGRKHVAQMYRENYDGCRALWIQRYRLQKAWRLKMSESPPIP